MKKQLMAASMVFLLSIIAIPTMAENGYLGIQYALTTYEQSGTGSTATDGEGEPKSIILVGGYQFTDNVAIEGRYGFNGGDDTFVFNDSTSAIMEVDRIFSVFTKLSLGGNVSPYLLLGYSDIELTTDSAGTAEGDSFSFGAGIDFSLSENVSAGLEYVNYLSSDIQVGGDADFSAVSLGVSLKF